MSSIAVVIGIIFIHLISKRGDGLAVESEKGMEGCDLVGAPRDTLACVVDEFLDRNAVGGDG